MRIFKNNKGFTIIEVLAVVTIIGILSTLAVPRFADHIEKTKQTQILNDIIVAENATQIYLIKNNDFFDFEAVSANTINEFIKNNKKVYNRKGLVKENIEDEFLYVLDDFIKKRNKFKLKG